MAAVGLGALAARPWRSAAALSGMFFALLFWVIGQGAGLLSSGHATDPNTGPLLVLLGVAVLGAPTDLKLSRVPGWALQRQAQSEGKVAVAVVVPIQVIIGSNGVMGRVLQRV